MKQVSDNNSLLIKGILYSNVLAFLCFAIAYTVTNWNEEIGFIFIFSEFVLVPIGMGIMCMKYWIHLNKRIMLLLPYVILNTIIALALSAIFMGEGVICLIIVSPLVLVFMWAGVVLGKYIFKYNTTIKSTTFSVLILLFIYDTLSEHNYTNMVSDEIVIDAPAHVVWKHVPEHSINTSAPTYWLFKIGLPNPIQSTVMADSVDAARQCVFSNGATFDEIVVERDENRQFTFDVVKQPDDPEIIGHINIQRGQFILKENTDGTTTLIGNSWYRLNVYPVWYYDLWAVDITREVHLRVMRHIKNLTENDV